MVRTIIHGARIGGGGQLGFSIPVTNFHLIAEGGGPQSGQGLLVLPPRCEFFLVRTLGCMRMLFFSVFVSEMAKIVKHCI